MSALSVHKLQCSHATRSHSTVWLHPNVILHVLGQHGLGSAWLGDRYVLNRTLLALGTSHPLSRDAVGTEGAETPCPRT